MRPALSSLQNDVASVSSTSVKTRPRRRCLPSPEIPTIPYLVVIGIAMLVSQVVGTQMKRAFAK
jgi:hypothetical protein